MVGQSSQRVDRSGSTCISPSFTLKDYMNKDSWCQPIRSSHGNRVSGGAARNVRIAYLGGMDEIISVVARQTLELANAAALKRS